jgi:hypothetical protein
MSATQASHRDLRHAVIVPTDPSRDRGNLHGIVKGAYTGINVCATQRL